jgi:hypothetical protein
MRKASSDVKRRAVRGHCKRTDLAVEIVLEWEYVTSGRIEGSQVAAWHLAGASRSSRRPYGGEVAACEHGVAR